MPAFLFTQNHARAGGIKLSLITIYTCKVIQ